MARSGVPDGGVPDGVGAVIEDGVLGMFPARGQVFSSGIAMVALVGLLAVLYVTPVAAQDEPSANSAPVAVQDEPSEKPAPTANGSGEGDQEEQATPPISPMWLIIGFGLIFYFIVLAPQKKAKKKQQALVDSLKKHDRVVTIGGIVGTIVSIDTANEEVVLEVGPDTQLRLLRRSIQGPKPFGSDDEAESGDK